MNGNRCVKRIASRMFFCSCCQIVQNLVNQSFQISLPNSRWPWACLIPEIPSCHSWSSLPQHRDPSHICLGSAIYLSSSSSFILPDRSRSSWAFNPGVLLCIYICSNLRPGHKYRSRNRVGLSYSRACFDSTRERRLPASRSPQKTDNWLREFYCRRK